MSRSVGVRPVTEIFKKPVSSQTGLPGAAVPTLHSRGHHGHIMDICGRPVISLKARGHAGSWQEIRAEKPSPEREAIKEPIGLC